MEILDNLEPLLKLYWYIAIPVSIIFFIQTIMTFFGGDSADGIEADFDGDLADADTPFQLFSFRNLVNFLLGFSWAGISFYEGLSNKVVLILVSIAIGVLFVYVFFLVIKQLQKLAENNSFKISNTLNKTAEVYLTIPGNKTGKGKIMISVNGAFHELDAITENETIPSGSVVKVARIESSILVVETI